MSLLGLFFAHMYGYDQIGQIERLDQINFLRERGYGELLDAMLDVSNYKKDARCSGALNISKCARVLKKSPPIIYRMLDEMKEILDPTSLPATPSSLPSDP